MRVSAASALTRSSTYNCMLHDPWLHDYMLQQQMYYWSAWITIRHIFLVLPVWEWRTCMRETEFMDTIVCQEENGNEFTHESPVGRCLDFQNAAQHCWAEVLLAPNAMSRDMKLFHFSFRHKWEKETFWAMQHQWLSSLYLNNEWLNVERYQLLLMRMCVSSLSSSQGVKKLKESKILKIGLEMCLQDLRYDINSRGRNARWGGRHHREKLQDG